MKKNGAFAKARAAAKHPKISSPEWRDFQGVLDPDPDVEKFKVMLKQAKERAGRKRARAASTTSAASE